ncbi:MAG TPA: 2Fe-2S iron-sulfur cluster binding domain-containing protein [Dehalococcoidia bacterium]|nr:2Fe-2S iron-sulfur cluster binding domain-containing protein [Dehalococcoidia bacterium]
MVTLTIDGKVVKAEEGAMVLDVATAHNIHIPTLCAHESVSPYGACRLCLVEVKTSRGRERLVTSCLYPVEEGLEVKTKTDRVIRNRQTIIELLLARCPESDVIKDMARELGVEQTPYPQEDHGNCILCALCVRACEEVVGASAISLVNRGVDREMAIPFYDDSNACIGCGSCSYICPTGAIRMEDSGDTRTITMPNNVTKFKMAKCSVCGDYFAPEKQIEFMVKKAGLEPDFFDRCINCRD